MKLAYRIITPILAVGSVLMGFFLKLFYFAIGTADESLSSIVQLVGALGVKTNYEFSAFEIIKLLLGMEPAKDDSASFAELVAPVMPHIISFIVFFVLTLLMFIAVASVAAATDKRNVVIGMCGGGLVLCFVCIVIAKLAFDKLIGGEISLSDLMGVFSENIGMQLLAAVVTITSATLSAGFYAVFGMYILIILWTVLCNMLIKTPIQVQKKHRRKKPMKRLSAIIHR
ncbi:MAG: hypothetical protein IJB93_04590 [Clostridia bacterium]|nr:hypothetical protein [Clostridia bacterium]